MGGDEAVLRRDIRKVVLEADSGKAANEKGR